MTGKRGKSGSSFHAKVTGRVQGVGFRYSCREKARSLGLSGWVQNLPGGEVEVWAEGSSANLEALLQWLKQGPPGSRVDSVQCEKQESPGTYRSFEIRY